MRTRIDHADVAEHAGLLQAIGRARGGFDDALELEAMLDSMTGGDAGQVRTLQPRLCALHGRIAAVAPNAFLTYRAWLPAFSACEGSEGDPCPTCGLPTHAVCHTSRRHPGYRRQISICLRDGIVGDLPVADWRVAVVDRTTVWQPGSTDDCVSARITVDSTDCTAALAIEFYGEPGAWGAPTTASPGTSADLSLPPTLRIPPGVHWLRVVVVVGLDFGYLRVPLTVLRPPAT